MKSKRKQIGLVFYTHCNTKGRKCFKKRTTKRNLLIKTLKNLLLDLQLKYQTTIFGEQMKLMRQNRVHELLKYVKTLKRQIRKVDQEQLKEYRNDRKLEKLFVKLGGIEKYLQRYNSQLNKGIQQGEAQTASRLTYGNNSFKSVEKPHEETVKTLVHFIGENSRRNVAKQNVENIPSAIVLAQRHEMKRDNSIKSLKTENASSKSLKPRNLSLRRLKTKNSFEKLLLGFLRKFEKPKTTKPVESLAKNKSNGAEIDKYVKRQGPISTKLVYKWPVSISAVVLAKTTRSNSRRRAFWQLRQISPSENNSHYQIREQLFKMAVQKKQINLHDYGSVSASQILKRRKIKHRDQLMELSSNQFTPHYEKSPLSQIDDVFDDLIEKNNEWQEYMRDLERSQDIIKPYLQKHYLQNVRTVLQNQVHQITQQSANIPYEPLEGEETRTRPLSWSAFGRNALKKNSLNSLGSTASKNETQIDRKLYCSNTLEMHRRFFTKQLMKLRNGFLTKNIKHLYKLIMNRELPIRQEDRDLLNEYALDPQHYNVLIMAIEPILPQPQSKAKMALIEENFNYIKELMERDSRRSRLMASSSFISCQVNQSDITPIMYEDDRGQFDFDKSYIKEQRAKWAKYFALQEKTPFELQLANKRTQKLQAKAARKALKKQRQSDVRKHLQISRSLSALYTEPRLTQRMRKVINEMAEDKREKPLRQTKRKESSTFFSITTEPRSCCSRCNMSQHDSCSLTQPNISCPPIVLKSYINCIKDTTK